MEFPTFMNYLTVLLGLLTTVVGAAVTFLFSVHTREQDLK